MSSHGPLQSQGLWPGFAALILALAGGAPPTAVTDESGIESTLATYLDQLSKLRAGDDAVLEGLRGTGRRLCESFGRCDAVDVLEFYAGLSAEERREGLERERAYHGIHEFVWELSSEGVPQGESWPELREEVCADLRELIAASEPRPDFTPAARAHALLAELMLSSDTGTRDRLNEVRDHADRAIELFGRAGQITPQLEPLCLLGKIQRVRGDEQVARTTFERCRALAARLARPEYEERALLGLVQLAKDAGDWRSVDECLAELATFRTPAESWPLAREHAARLVHLDQPEAALRFLLNYPPRAASHDSEWHTMLSSAFLRSGDLAAARREMLELDDASEELRTLTWASLDLANGEAEVAIERLAAYTEQGGVSRAGFDAWTPQGRVQAWSFLGEAALALGRPQDALRWLGSAVAGADEWDDVRTDGSGSVVGEWLGLHVVVLLARAHIELGAALEAARVIEDFQSRQLRRAGGQGPAEVTREVLLEWSGRFEGGLITWVIGSEYGVVAHVARDGDAWAGTVTYGRRAVQAAVRRLREATIVGDSERAAGLARQIGAELLPTQLRERLARLASKARALFVLHGPLEALPLALMELDGGALDLRLTPLVLPGLPHHSPAAHTGATAAALAGPTAGNRTEWTLLGSPMPLDGSEDIPLPGAARELAGLGRIYPRARSFTGASFTRAAISDALSGGGPLHIATHLVTSADCEGSSMAPVGLQLSGNGVLCAKDIEAMRPRLPLVVLTACETAGGRFIDGEGMHGISRAFLASGTANLVTTLWPVEDGAAYSFALLLHQGLVDGQSPAHATAAARMAMRAGGAAPVDWAAFRFMGSD